MSTPGKARSDGAAPATTCIQRTAYFARPPADPRLFTVPHEIRMAVQPYNPALPPLKDLRSSPLAQSTSAARHQGASTIGIGSRREYLNITVQGPIQAYPPRVPPGSVADLDMLYEV